MSPDELLLELRTQFPHLQPVQLQNYLRRAGTAVREERGRLFAAPLEPISQEVGSDQANSADDSCLNRFVAFDLESVVWPIAKEPYKEQHVFQIGAVRFGTDREWIKADRYFNHYIELPNEAERLINHEDVLEQYLDRSEPLADVLGAFRRFCNEAEVLVAYNGTTHDFPLLEQEYVRAELEPLSDVRRRLGPRLVDGLYLAQALWPIPPRQHRLAMCYSIASGYRLKIFSGTMH